jgi:RNA polymerase sigma factor (sigma-70 family)
LNPEDSIGLPITDAEFEQLRARLKKSARSLIGKELRRNINSSDLVQETLLITFDKLSKIIGQPKRTIYQWMLTVMRHQALRQANMIEQEKGSQGRVREEAEELLVDELLIESELKSLVMAELENCSEDCQKIFRLRYFEGLRIEEIAQRLDTTEASVRGVIFRTLQKIRGKFRDEI